MKEIIESSTFSEDGNTAIFKSGKSGMHMRPVTTLAKILKEFALKNGIDIAVIVYDENQRELRIPLDKVGPLNFDLLKIRNGKLFGIQIITENSKNKELLLWLVKEIEGMESIGISVPNRVNELLGTSW